MILFKERYSNEIPKLLKLLGVTRICENSIEFTWGYISFGGGPELQLDHTYEYGVPRLCFWFFWIVFHVELPFIKQRYDDVNNSPRYGFSYHDKSIWWHWNLGFWAFHMPWDWQHVRHTILSPDGSVCCDANDLENSWEPPEEIKEIHDFTYRLKTGEVQHRKATIYGGEREWRWRWFQWLPFPRMIRRTISIGFDEEVGNRSGSWKGGILGMGKEWLKGESMADSLKRVESDPYL